MAISIEDQEYHLTSDGWVEGSFKGDVVGGKIERPIPKNRVLTIVKEDRLSDFKSGSVFSYREIWRSEDNDLVKKLLEKYGDKPNF